MCGMCCPGNKWPPLPRYTPAPSITGSLQVLPMHAETSALFSVHCPYMQRRVLPPDLIGVQYFGNVCYNQYILLSLLPISLVAFEFHSTPVGDLSLIGKQCCSHLESPTLCYGWQEAFHGSTMRHTRTPLYKCCHKRIHYYVSGAGEYLSYYNNRENVLAVFHFFGNVRSSTWEITLHSSLFPVTYSSAHNPDTIIFYFIYTTETIIQFGDGFFSPSEFHFTLHFPKLRGTEKPNL